ncbi:unnamed protein product [Fraxinus pennsylvanica]|uniref:Uncharacterized protein n=1 Tax=Fraxinus pennsylvanica TaxID=56036 RepID=A0AAD1ZW97_9LAMI|nr:unnamed protein product [Fraxinus pennsylvanica]
MQALEEAPHNMQCENKFLIQSLVVSSGATIEDVEILFDEEGHQSQNGLLNAEYIFPRQVQSVVPDGIFDEEGHRSHNGLRDAEYIFPRQVQSGVPDGIVSPSLASEVSVCR